MPMIAVDDEVLAAIRQRALTYVDRNESDTLRRILGVPKPEDCGESKRTPTGAPAVTAPVRSPVRSGRRKQAKASLLTLVEAGLLEEGQVLHLRDYGASRLAEEARIAGRSLLMDGVPHSMSEAAKLGLQKHGYVSDSVRGPAHWFTDDGKSVRELWEQHLRAIA